MKRYLLFTFDGYYPLGGWSDFEGSFDSVEEAMLNYNARFMSDGRYRGRDDSYLGVGGYYQVVDTHTQKIVAGEGYEPE